MDNAAPTPGARPGDSPADQPSPTPPPAGDATDTSTHPSGGQSSDPGPNRSALRDLADLRRSATNRHVGGVAGGLGRHFDVDPTVIRILLVVLTFFGGAGLLAYVCLWLLVPEEGQPTRPLGLDDRSRSVAVMIVGGLSGLVALASVAGDGMGDIWWIGPIAAFAALVLVLTERSRRNGPPQPPYGQPPYGQGAGQPPYGHGAEEPPTGTSQFAATPGPAPEPGTWSPEQRAQAPYAGVQTAPAPPRTYPMPPPPRRTNPRRRGPILFGFTVALVAVGIGVLATLELAGVAVTGSAYPALGLAITALMLLVGAFWGRAGGLIALGLLFTVVTVGMTAADHFGRDDLAYRPTTASQVQDTYEIHAGALMLDLREVTDPARLSGREISIDAGAGEVHVIVPAGLDVRVSSDVGVGESTLFGESTDGVGVGHVVGDDRPGVPDLTINIDLGVGSVVVEQENGAL